MPLKHGYGEGFHVERYAKSLEYEELKKYTNNFSEDSYICKFQHGTLYRGKDGGQDVIVKIWDGNHMYESDVDDRYFMFKDDICLLNSDEIRGHPNLMKAIGFCDHDPHTVAIVYDFKPLDTVHNLIPRGSYLWHHRIKVALGFASLLNCLHSSGFRIRNIDAAHIMCDHDYTPKLYDFSMIDGGFYRRKFYGSGCHGYKDPWVGTGVFSRTCDVFAYGIVLLSLITKRVFNAETDADENYVTKWAESEYKKLKLRHRWPSLVHRSLMSEQCFYPRDGRRITKLAMQCIKYDAHDRPVTEEIVTTLRSLQIVRDHGDDFGVHCNCLELG